jgi:hypothetical protein
VATGPEPPDEPMADLARITGDGRDPAAHSHAAARGAFRAVLCPSSGLAALVLGAAGLYG